MTAGRRETMWQLVRYGVNGGIVTGLYTLVFIAVDTWTHATAQICNVAGYVAALLFGYVVHSRVTFRNHGARGRGSPLRFEAVTNP